MSVTCKSNFQMFAAVRCNRKHCHHKRKEGVLSEMKSTQPRNPHISLSYVTIPCSTIFSIEMKLVISTLCGEKSIFLDTTCPCVFEKKSRQHLCNVLIISSTKWTSLELSNPQFYNPLSGLSNGSFINGKYLGLAASESTNVDPCSSCQTKMRWFSEKTLSISKENFVESLSSVPWRRINWWLI